MGLERGRRESKKERTIIEGQEGKRIPGKERRGKHTVLEYSRNERHVRERLEISEKV